MYKQAVVCVISGGGVALCAGAWGFYLFYFFSFAWFLSTAFTLLKMIFFFLAQAASITFTDE